MDGKLLSFNVPSFTLFLNKSLYVKKQDKRKKTPDTKLWQIDSALENHKNYSY